MTYDKLVDRVVRVTKGLPAEALNLLYEAENDFILRTKIIKKSWVKPVVPLTGTITGVTESSSYALFACAAHGLAVGDYVQVHGTTNYNGQQKVTDVSDPDAFVTDHAYGATEAGLTASFRSGFLFDLPADFVDYERVEWKGMPLRALNQGDYPWVSETSATELRTGEVVGCWIEGRRLRLLPAPSDSSTIIMLYAYYNTESSPTSPVIPSLYHQFMADYAISYQLESQGDESRANRYLEKYLGGVELVLLNNAMLLI
jgi:hypothetical protein